MSFFPKTPSRSRARSDAKTPLTPSLVAAMNNVSLASSPTKRPRAYSKSKPITATYDTTNPFIVPASGRSRSQSHSRPASPVKRIASGGIAAPDSLKRQNGVPGVIRKGGFESRLDVDTRAPPPKSELKRSRSTPAANRIQGEQKDRFITNPIMTDSEHEVAPTLDPLALNINSASPGHTARLAIATGVPLNKRILGYHEAPPLPTSDTTLAQQREVVRPLFARTITPGKTSSTKARKIAHTPIRVLDAEHMQDDFYLNVVAWSSQNKVGVALDTSTYLWTPDTGAVMSVGEAPEGTYVSSLEFSQDGMFIGVGNGNGDVELWDCETGQKLRTMGGHTEQVGCLSFNQHILSSGCGDGSIWHHDVRIARHKVMELNAHNGEVCGLKWRPDGELLASGANDNVVNIWDCRVGDVNENSRSTPKWTKRNHTAAVKALAWCPWQPSLLATGGGTNDATINVWNSSTGARLHTVKTPAQVTSIIWAPHRKEIFSTHGYPTNAIMLHSYPNMEVITEIGDAHESRILFSAIAPTGDLIATGAGDECLKIWRIWDDVAESKGKKKKGFDDETGGGIHGRLGSTNAGVMSIR
ncbi:WD40 repeat-like protein [Fistulina hepatica ATCC 64428]|uniref:WD40 repeat-like protein n=1 Tax=Fistulina hepatica ATCC 64428 TaxID=1128425 RepID=A0A0D7AS29_9AGAR|nr:WD40 repeat-like protein [Fistulina hepatica ATCC 64428]